MASGDRDRFLALSPTFYGKERSLADICLEADICIANNPEFARFLQPHKEVQELITGKQKAQRALIEGDGLAKVLACVFEVLEKGQQHKNLLMILLPTLDGILFGNADSWVVLTL